MHLRLIHTLRKVHAAAMSNNNPTLNVNNLTMECAFFVSLALDLIAIILVTKAAWKKVILVVQSKG